MKALKPRLPKSSIALVSVCMLIGQGTTAGKKRYRAKGLLEECYASRSRFRNRSS